MKTISACPRTAKQNWLVFCHSIATKPSILATWFLVLSSLLGANMATAADLTILHSFTYKPDGDLLLYAGVVRDTNGNLYGTTYGGGTYNQGTVYEISGGTETILHDFYWTAGGSDGALPQYGLTMDSQGNLYGTTYSGGAHDEGIIFKISKSHQYSVLYSFSSMGSPGVLAVDSQGNLYGAVEWTRAQPYVGLIFRLTAGGTYTVLHSFQGGQDGAIPGGALLLDQSGNLYGSTWEGGGSAACYAGCGVIFEVTAAGAYTVLHRFGGGTTDGGRPFGKISMDVTGNLYGTTLMGGVENWGTVFMLSKASAWSTSKLLFKFDDINYNYGLEPYSGIVLDSHGNAFGSTNSGGLYGWGVVFEIKADGEYSVLANLQPGPSSVNTVYSGLIIDSEGNLYGTSTYGGSDNEGTVFKVSGVK